MASSEWNLLNVGKNLILKDMIEGVQRSLGSSSSDWSVLIVDERALRIIGSCLRMFDVMEENIVVIENLKMKRQPFPTFPGIYFVTPTEESVNHIIEDFSTPGKTVYKSAHIFFTSTATKSLIVKLGKIKPYVKSLFELNIDYLPVEPRVFQLGMPNSFYNLYSPKADISEKEIDNDVIVRRLATFCLTFGEYPVIRYENEKASGSSSSSSSTASSNSTEVAKTIAMKLKDVLNDYVRRGKLTIKKGGKRSVLVIAGRSVDTKAPILSEFTYQAMVEHLLKIENGNRYKFVYAGRPKEVTLDDNDELWVKLRHTHIAEASGVIAQSFNSFVSSNKIATSNGAAKSAKSFKELSSLIKGLPEYGELMSKYALHIALADEAFKQFNVRKLTDVAGLEQDLATGFDKTGEAVKPSFMATLTRLLEDATITKEDKLRLIMLWVIYANGLKDSNRERVMEYAKLTPEEQISIASLYYLGVNVSSKSSSSSHKDKKKRKIAAEASKEVSYDLSRYVPRVYNMFMSLSKNTLSSTEFPYVDGGSSDGDIVGSADDDGKDEKKTSLKTNAPKWLKKGKAKGGDDDGSGAAAAASFSADAPKYFIFIAGGMTYSEMRSAYEVSNSEGKNCYIGSTSILTPQLFVDELIKLNK